MAQTGATAAERWRFLDDMDRLAVELIPSARWEIEQVAAATF